MIRIRGGETLDNMQGVTVKVAGSVEPSLVVEAGGVDDQRLSLPTAVGPAHPAVGGRFRLIVQVDGADCGGILMNDHDVLCALNDLERLRHICGARNTRQVTLDLGIESETIFEVLLLLCGCFGQVWNRTSLDDTETRSNGIGSAQRKNSTRRRRVAFDVPVGFVQSLPNAAQVGFAVSGARSTIGLGLNGCGTEKQSHQCTNG